MKLVYGVKQENGEEAFQELKDLFEEMFESDIESLSSSSQTGSATSHSSLFSSCGESLSSNKRGSSEMSDTKVEDAQFEGFCIGVGVHYSWFFIVHFLKLMCE